LQDVREAKHAEQYDGQDFDRSLHPHPLRRIGELVNW
jgi:hypothetical protein